MGWGKNTRGGNGCGMGRCEKGDEWAWGEMRGALGGKRVRGSFDKQQKDWFQRFREEPADYLTPLPNLAARNLLIFLGPPSSSVNGTLPSSSAPS